MTVKTRTRNDSPLAELVAAIVVTLLHAFVLALPIMWLSAFLAGQGWAVTPLGYWASYFTALMLGWILDGAGTVRRALDNS